MKLKPKSFNYVAEKNSELNLPKGKRAGLIAQDVEGVFPQLVGEAIQPTLPKKSERIGKRALPIPPPDQKKFKTVNYVELIPILAKAIQEQQITIQNLEKEVQQLKGY
jgi:hypothetical protein